MLDFQAVVITRRKMVSWCLKSCKPESYIETWQEIGLTPGWKDTQIGGLEVPNPKHHREEALSKCAYILPLGPCKWTFVKRWFLPVSLCLCKFMVISSEVSLTDNFSQPLFSFSPGLLPFTFVLDSSFSHILKDSVPHCCSGVI